MKNKYMLSVIALILMITFISACGDEPSTETHDGMPVNVTFGIPGNDESLGIKAMSGASKSARIEISASGQETIYDLFDILTSTVTKTYYLAPGVTYLFTVSVYSGVQGGGTLLYSGTQSLSVESSAAPPTVNISMQESIASTVLIVDAINGDNQLGDGSLSNPYQSISEAFRQISAPGYKVIVAPGTYNLALEGAFPLTFPQNSTTLECASSDTIISSTDVVRGVSYMIDSGGQTGATITNCRIIVSSMITGIYDDYAPMTISNVLLEGQGVRNVGIEATDSTSIINSTITNFVSDGCEDCLPNGYGITTYGDINVSGSSITSNDTGLFAQYGAIITVSDSTFHCNTDYDIFMTSSNASTNVTTVNTTWDQLPVRESASCVDGEQEVCNTGGGTFSHTGDLVGSDTCP